MKYYKIIFKANKKKFVQDAEIIVYIDDYLGCLYKNGQLVEYDDLFIKDDCIFCCVTLPEEEAFSAKNNNEYVSQSQEKVKRYFDIFLEEMGDNWYLDCEVCKCECPSYYVLNCDALIGDTVATDSPISCGDCGSPVPLYKLPKILGESDFYTVREFEREYKAIEVLWISCLNDKFTFKQRNKSSSQLFKKARKICTAFEEATGIKFYYQVPLDDISSTKCPFCGEPFKIEDNYKCIHCQVIVTIK